MNETAYLEALEQAVPAALGYLTEAGFAYSGARRIDGGRLIGQMYCAEFESREVGRRISVTVYPETSQHPDVLGLTVSIIRANSFSVVSYLQKHGATEQELARFKLESYSGSLAERLRVCLLAFREFLDGPIKDIVAGTRWEDVDTLSQYR